MAAFLIILGFLLDIAEAEVIPKVGSPQEAFFLFFDFSLTVGNPF